MSPGCPGFTFSETRSYLIQLQSNAKDVMLSVTEITQGIKQNENKGNYWRKVVSFGRRKRPEMNTRQMLNISLCCKEVCRKKKLMVGIAAYLADGLTYNTFDIVPVEQFCQIEIPDISVLKTALDIERR